MKQVKAKDKLTGAAGFEQFYSERFGERWSVLREALKKESAPIAFWAAGEKQFTRSDEGTPPFRQAVVEPCRNTQCTAPLPYYLDAASIMAASALPAGRARILDMCAAPGGKSLVIAAGMQEGSTLVCNERSAARYKRLLRTLDECLAPVVRCRVTAVCQDAATLCKKTGEAFDRILLDAPCSSERHVIMDAKYQRQWTPARIKSLAIAQWALISSAWRMLESGGYLLYSTCALCREENDGIIERLLGKFDDAVAIKAGGFLPLHDVPASTPSTLSLQCPDYAEPASEETQYGRAVLPDTGGGAGPIYFALVRKGKYSVRSGVPLPQ